MKLTKVRKSGKLFLIIPILMATGLFGCSDDTVTPVTNEFDPPRFNWRSMDINNYGFSSMWAMDTSRVFMLNYLSKSLYIISGGYTAIHYVGEFGLNELQGTSGNEVYIFGITAFPDNKLTIIKWNGAGFEYYSTNIEITPGWGPWVMGYVINSNDIWVLSRNGIVNFDGNKMTDYIFEDVTLQPVDLFLSNDNKLQYIAGKYIETTHIEQCLFEFRDTGFVRIYDGMTSYYPDYSFTFLSEAGGEKFGYIQHYNPYSICIDYFTGSSFTPYFCFNEKISVPLPTESNNPVGASLQNFIFFVETPQTFFEHTRKGLIHWNGIRISKELELSNRDNYPHDRCILYYTYNGSFLVLEPYSETQVNCTLHFGTKK